MHKLSLWNPENIQEHARDGTGTCYVLPVEQMHCTYHLTESACHTIPMFFTCLLNPAGYWVLIRVWGYASEQTRCCPPGAELLMQRDLYHESTNQHTPGCAAVSAMERITGKGVLRTEGTGGTVKGTLSGEHAALPSPCLQVKKLR